jgi:hypothetical protein
VIGIDGFASGGGSESETDKSESVLAPGRSRRPELASAIGTSRYLTMDRNWEILSLHFRVKPLHFPMILIVMTSGCHS